MRTARPAMDKKNLIITIVLSALIMVCWQYFYEMPRLKEHQSQQAQQHQEHASKEQAAEHPAQQAAPSAAPSTGATAPTKTREEAIAQSPRVAIDTPRLHGSIALKG